jgi:phosphoglycerol geranylgeranyltransferase
LVNLGPVEKSLISKTRRGTICAALIDPEDFTPADAAKTAKTAAGAGVSLILVGGSTLGDQSKLDEVVISIKHHVKLPVILFPGNVTGVSKHADAILFSSLLNSTNPYFIIGAQALGAMSVYEAGIESIPMGYLVFGNTSATSFIGQVNGLPHSKPSLAVIYAMAAKYLGMRSLYLEGGSGSSQPVPAQTIRAVRKYYDGLLIVGGGIVNGESSSHAASAGADIIVVGNLLQTEGYEAALKEIVGGTARK